MERRTKGGNAFPKKYPTGPYDKEFSENGSMTSTIFQPPPREDLIYNKMAVKWNCNNSCNHSPSICPTDEQINTLRQTQDVPVLSKYLDNNWTSFLHDNTTSTKTNILAPPCSNCRTAKELCFKSNGRNACRNSHEDSLNSDLLYEILPKENNLDFCMNEEINFISNEEEQLVEAEKVFAVVDNAAITDRYREAYKDHNIPYNNFFQLYATPESIINQNYNSKQPTFDKDQVYVDHAVPEFSTSGSSNCLIVPQNDSFEQICMLNTAVSYMCENEIQKIFIKTGTTAEMGPDIHSIMPPDTINVCNMTPREANNMGDSPNINPCYKANDLELDARHYFSEDMAKLIYEINAKLGKIPPSSTLNHVSQICETAKEYCEKYSHSAPVSRIAFKNLVALFLQVAYSWVASYESMKGIGLPHPDLKNHLMNWKNSSEGLLNMLIYAINNWKYLVDSNQLGTPDCNQMVTFKPLIYHPLPIPNRTSHTQSEMTSSPYFKDCQYITKRANECLLNVLCNDVIGNQDNTFKRNNSCKADNNESKSSFRNSSANTFQYGNSVGECMTEGPTNKTERENVSHSSEFLEVQPLLDKKHKNHDTKIPGPFSYNFKNHESSNESKSFVTYKKMKTNSEEKNVEVGTVGVGNINMLHKQIRSTSLNKKFNKSDFTIRHPGILPITCLEKANTMSTCECKVYKDTENTREHHHENHYPYEPQKLKNTLPQQTISSGRVTSGAKKQMKRPFSKVGGKRTKNFDHSQNCDSDTSEAYDYIRPGSYKVPLKYSTEIHKKCQGIFKSSFKLDSADNKKVQSEQKPCFAKNANETTDVMHKTDIKVQQKNILHHKSITRGDVMEKTVNTKSLMTNYPKHLSTGKRPTVYWNKNEHQLPRCHSYYNARQRETFCHRRTESSDTNMPVSSLNSTTMNTFEEQMPIIKTDQNFSVMKKCKLESNTFPGT